MPEPRSDRVQHAAHLATASGPAGDDLISRYRACVDTGLGQKALAVLIASGRLNAYAIALPRPGANRRGHARDQVRRSELLDLLAKLEERPDACSRCGRPVPPGHRWHRRCAASARIQARLQATDDEISRLKHAEGLVDTVELAAELHVAKGTVWALRRQLKVGVRTALPGGERWLYREEDRGAIKAALRGRSALYGQCCGCGAEVYKRKRCEDCGRRQRADQMRENTRAFFRELERRRLQDGLAALGGSELADQVSQHLGRLHRFAPSRVELVARELGVGTAMGRGVWGYSLADVWAIANYLKDLGGTAVPYRDPEYVKKWKAARWPEQKRQSAGRLATALAKQNEKRVGRPQGTQEIDRDVQLSIIGHWYLDLSFRQNAKAHGVTLGAVQRCVNAWRTGAITVR